MNPPAIRLWRRNARLVGTAVVLALVVILAASAYAGYPSGQVTARLGLVTLPPGFPGDEAPNVYFWINYSGPGVHDATYRLSYNDSSGKVDTLDGSVILKPGAPFTYYLADEMAPGQVGFVNVAVFSGAAGPDARLDYNSTIWV